MELYENIWGRNDDLLESINFCINQFKNSKLIFSDIQHEKVLSDIDMDFEELIGVLLSIQEELKTS